MDKKLRVANFLGVVLFASVFVFVTGRYFGLFKTAMAVDLTDGVSLAVKDAMRPMRLENIREEYGKYELPEGAQGLFSSAPGGSVPVLVFHGLPEVATAVEDVSIEQFKQDMFALKKSGYRTITVDQLHAFMRGEIALDDRTVLITFDDGNRTSYENADDVLEALDFNAVMFVISGYSLDGTKSHYLHDDDLRRMLAGGNWEIQSHTHHTHYRAAIDAEGTLGPALANLLWLPEQGRLETEAEFFRRVNADLRMAKLHLSAFTGKPVFAFAPPYNDFGQLESNYPGATKVVLDAIWKNYDLMFYQFRTTVGGEFRANFPSTEAKRPVVRISMGRDVTVEGMLQRLAASERKVLPYVETFSNPFSWVDAVSTHEMVDGGMDVGSARAADIYFGYLDGSYDWTDYRYDVALDWRYGRTVSLVSRLVSTNNHLDCEYKDDGSVRLVRKTPKTAEDPVGAVVYADVKTGIGPSERMQRFGMEVAGDTATCLVEGVPVITAQLPEDVPYRGGVGIQTWDPALGATKVVVRSVLVRFPEQRGTYEADFDSGRQISEASSFSASSDPYWWLNSGAWLDIEDGVGKTVHGPIADGSRWQVAYERHNTYSTSGGRYPQNIFRLLTMGTWKDFTQETDFRIDANNFVNTEKRNESNGVFLMNRYLDEDNLYYAGLRVDGNAVIKKKIGGVYHVLAIAPAYEGTYERSAKPTLLPLDQWMGLRTVVADRDGGVDISLYTRPAPDAEWALAATAFDPAAGGAWGDPLLAEGHGGLRTDFMDVSFDDYSIAEAGAAVTPNE